MARLTWVFAVAWLMVRAVAMSELLRPCATSPTISFSRAVSWSRACGVSRGSRRVAEPGDQPAGQSRGQECFAARDDADPVQQLAGLGVLDQEACGACAQCLDDVLVVVEGGEDEHVDAREVGVGGDLAGRAQPVDAGHPDVHQHHVGVGLAGQVDRGGSVGGLTDHDHAGLGVDEYPEAAPHECFVVGDEHADGLGQSMARAHVVIIAGPGSAARRRPRSRLRGAGPR